MCGRDGWISEGFEESHKDSRLGPNEAYVDYMGGALYPASLISVHAEFLQSAVLGNTHSESPKSASE
jgi:hypothetical protein